MGVTFARDIEEKVGLEKEMAGKELGEAIIRLREKAGWNQEELAQRIGLHQTRVSKIENGNHNFPLETIYRLALAFKISPFELAAIYWGVKVNELPDKEKELLDSIIELVEDYRSNASPIAPSPPTTTLRHPSSPASPHDAAGIEARIKRRQDAKDKGKTENRGPGNSKSEGEEKDN